MIVSVPLMRRDLRNLGSLILIQITPKGTHPTANSAHLSNTNETGHSQIITLIVTFVACVTYNFCVTDLLSLRDRLKNKLGLLGHTFCHRDLSHSRVSTSCGNAV